MTPFSPKRSTTALNAASETALSRSISVQKSYTMRSSPLIGAGRRASAAAVEVGAGAFGDGVEDGVGEARCPGEAAVRPEFVLGTPEAAGDEDGELVEGRGN